MPRNKPPEIVYVPSVRAGRGSGHLRRALAFLAQYGDAAVIFIPPVANSIDYEGLVRDSGIHPDRICSNPQILESAGCIIADLFRTEKTLFGLLDRGVPLIGIDEGGSMRSRFPFLIDTLPNLKKATANISDYSFILPDKPAGRGQHKTGKTGKILVCFGGEDPAGLGERFASLIAESGVTAVFAMINLSSRHYAVPANVELLPPQPDLATKMTAYDGCIASFGLTAMEAVWAGLPCLLFNPTAYHSRAARRAGFSCSRRPGISRRLLHDFLDRPHKYMNNTLAGLKPRSMVSFIQKSIPQGYTHCPVCGRNGSTVCRTEQRRYAKCPRCGLVFMFSFGEKTEKYGEAYFDAEYKNQYGKTYLEDFAKIQGMGSERIRFIEHFSRSGGKRLLDIGCAYGPFLKAAAVAGYDAAGCDISPAAVDYVRNSLGLSAWTVSGTDTVFGEGAWDVITMWYVVEHLDDLGRFLRTAGERLHRGGVFAFATPNLKGISGRKDLRSFLEGGPKDHYTVWSPASAKKILKKAGFSICRVRITGHHPERFPFSSRVAGGAGYTFRQKISKIAGLGDTFEIYARKE
ncbi:MAG: methyltransferase domain-containing protein [Spirochaetales bacterium]|nr:methyltransferase domain-containing protein [Spirochaetales bacterium]